MARIRSGLVLWLVLLIPTAVSAEGERLAGFKDRMVDVEGGRLCCAHRPGDGPTLLLIPGTFSDSRVYAKMIPHLDKDLNLLILENRGLGKSWPPPENGSIEQCAGDALQVADKLKLATFYIGGHSLGGMISLEVGRRAPQRLRGVISLEGWTNSDAARDAFHHDMKATLTDEQLAEKAAYRQEVLAKWTPEQIAAFGKVWRQWDGRSFLEQTTLPVLEIYGDRGRARPTLDQLHIPQRDNIQLVWVENSSHALPIQHPMRVATAINRFIREQEARQARE